MKSIVFLQEQNTWFMQFNTLWVTAHSSLKSEPVGFMGELVVL